MSGKAFGALLGAVLLFGATLGGSFVGGYLLGGGNSDSPSESTASGVLPEVPRATTEDETAVARGQLRQQFQSGQELSEEEIDQIRQQFQAQGGGGFQGRTGGGLGGPGGGGGLIGTIEEISGSTITLSTPQGTLQAAIGPDTVIQGFTELTLADLLTGSQITVAGDPADGGGLSARSITVVPEGLGGFTGGFGLRGALPSDGSESEAGK